MSNADNTGRGAEETSQARDLLSSIDRTTKIFFGVLKLIALGALLLWIAMDYDFLKDWMRDLTHAEVFGVKIDRAATDKAASELDDLISDKKVADPDLDREIALGAITRATHVAPAIVRAKVLWVDDEPSNNVRERRILEALRIDVTLVKTTAEAFRTLRRSPYDLIISDVWRKEDVRVQLNRCRVHYFDYPDESLRQRYAVGSQGLIDFNIAQNREGPAGFSMIEQLVPEDGMMNPPVIFYAGRQASTVRSLCGEKITNRVDVLLHAVVSALEEQRWNELVRKIPNSSGTSLRNAGDKRY
jgi:CheY-like chemotaxis protein